jgi:hypothetical protein
MPPVHVENKVFNMDKKKSPKWGFALRSSRKTTGFIIDAIIRGSFRAFNPKK